MKYDYSDSILTIESNRLNFVKNTLEKVYRLLSILEFINNNLELNGILALKGGTAINLCVLNLPRLSVDLDFDLSLDCSREEMIEKRAMIHNIITKHMEREGYTLSSKSKFVHSLDSYKYLYNTVSNSKDQIKLDINYSNRIHLLPTIEKRTTEMLKEQVSIRIIDPIEMIGSKISALLSRTMMRDVYDVYNLLSNRKITDKNFVKKIAIFYVCLGSEIPIDINQILETAKERIRNSIFQEYKETIVPVIHRGVFVEVDNIKTVVIKFLEDDFVLTSKEKEFIKLYNQGIINQQLLFGDYKVNDISNHPMVLWKIKNIRHGEEENE